VLLFHSARAVRHLVLFLPVFFRFLAEKRRIEVVREGWIERWRVGRNFARMSNESISASPTKEKTVLIVDDDRDIGELLQEIIIEQTDYHVVWIAESDLVIEAASYLHPSLLLLDYMLPTMDGMHLYDRLQELETMRGVPTVLISASPTLPFDELRSRGIYLLRKPFELSDLLDILAQFLS
jgi:CheY-like chemotaxis protein